MPNLMKKSLVLTLLCTYALSGTLSFAHTSGEVHKEVKKAVTQSTSTMKEKFASGKVLVDGEKDFLIEFDKQYKVIKVSCSETLPEEVNKLIGKPVTDVVELITKIHYTDQSYKVSMSLEGIEAEHLKPFIALINEHQSHSDHDDDDDDEDDDDHDHDHNDDEDDDE